MYLVPLISGRDGMEALNLVERAYHLARAHVVAADEDTDGLVEAWRRELAVHRQVLPAAE